MLRRVLVLSLACLGLMAANAHGYGKKGHQTVGAIADLRLAGKPMATKISELLDGLTLEEAALLADEIKAWDFGPRSRFTLPGHQGIEDQLFAFVQANRTGKGRLPTHHDFHFTDVPVFGNSNYGDGKTGRSQFDVVQMIPFCIKVLKGEVEQPNDRMITKPLAVILLAHYVGDIHQPLHVGAEYFDAKGQPTNPDKGGQSVPDQGGNSLQLVLQRTGSHGHPISTKVFHTYWDDDTVDTAFDFIKDELTAAGRRQIGDTEIVRRLASVEPDGWQSAAKLPVEKWSEKWANEILPIASEAHSCLDFQHIHITVNKAGEKLAHGQAVERTDQMPAYHEWAGQRVREQLHKAGWRLAALLEEIL